MFKTQTPDMTFRRILLLPAIILLFLTACQPIQGPHTRPQPVEIETLAAEQSGDLAQAADEYMALAAESDGEKQALYALRAASLYWQLEQIDNSHQAMSQLDASVLSAQRRFEALLLRAKLALHENKGETALKVLDGIDENNLSAAERQQLFQLKIDGYALTENWVEKANTHLKLDKVLAEPTAVESNRDTLWQTLMKLSPQALDLFNPGIPPADDSGWFALAYAIKAYDANPEALEVALEDWRRSYPNHPADPELYEDVTATGTRLPTEIRDIAVLLPGSGPYVEVARAIKEGIIAAHYASGSNARLHFLETSTDEYSGRSNVLQQYNEAVSRGASIVIGPLQKASVDTLSTSSDLPVPVLALNRIDDRLSRPNLFQFGLAPEDDAVASAQFARQQGYQRAVILAPQGDWGERVANAFAQAWREQNGSVLYRASYDESENDFRGTLIPLMGLDESERRYNSLKGTLGRAMDFEPRRRQDIDFLFMVAKPFKARQLVPQLKFHRSGRLPLIATSHAYTGQPNAQQDIDLNDLYIPDIPWMFAENAEQDPAYQSLQNQSAENFGGLLRLYAMGVDAYRLVSEINTLSRDPEQKYHGATGVLSINAQGQVERGMPWARFKQGELELIE
ncbi:penicillin-binding protein activator [Methylophaga sp.]|uniref:penicillin-binding protein activator n=1 Tax=Methylophaga sp. TaxID=2024840 RepID=UPI003F6A1DBD